MDRSIYEKLQAHDELLDASDIEDQAGMDLDEENLGTGFNDYELEHAAAFEDDASSRITTESTTFPSPPNRRTSSTKGNGRNHRHATWANTSPGVLGDGGDGDADDDVPASLLIEDDEHTQHPSPLQQRTNTLPSRHGTGAVPGPSTREMRSRWEAAQAHQQLHRDDVAQQSGKTRSSKSKPSFVMGSRYDKAMYRWANVRNLDNFVGDVYDYYRGAGIYCILLNRALNLW